MALSPSQSPHFVQVLQSFTKIKKYYKICFFKRICYIFTSSLYSKKFNKVHTYQASKTALPVSYIPLPASVNSAGTVMTKSRNVLNNGATRYSQLSLAKNTLFVQKGTLCMAVHGCAWPNVTCARETRHFP